MRKIGIYILLLNLFAFGSAFADSSAKIDFGFFKPIGYYQTLMDPAYSFHLNFSFENVWIQNLSLQPEAGFIFSQFTYQQDKKYNLIPIGALAEYSFQIMPDFYVLPHAGTGFYFLNFQPGSSFIDFYFKTGASLSYEPSSNIRLVLSADFFYFHDPEQGISGWNFTGGLNYSFGSKKYAGSLIITDAKIDSIFSSAYQSYYKKPAGKIQVKNIGEEPLESIKLSFFIKSLMDQPTISRYQPSMLQKNQSISIPVYCFFNKNIQSLDSDLETQAQIEITFESVTKKQTIKQNKKIKIYSKNTIIWDNLNRMGSFISLQDPSVSNFARQAISISTQKTDFSEQIINLIKIVESIRFYPIRYVKDPKNSYQNFLSPENGIDVMQYPRETLRSKTGACSDLTALTAALLENIGIQVALIATDTHIFLMAETKGIQSELLITYMGKTWLPIETTEIDKGFTTAWKKGFENYQNCKTKKIKTVIESITEYPPLSIETPADIFFNPKALELEQNVNRELAEVLRILRK